MVSSMDLRARGRCRCSCTATIGPIGAAAHARRDPYTRPVLRTVVATRYVTPLREGGSVPALVEADDDGLYVVKLLGAGHGRKALVAELLAGEIARHLGLPVPDQVLVELDGALSKAEPDGEIQDLLERSAGTNFGLDFLPGALAFAPDREAAPRPGPGGGRRVARRVHDERRPDAAQPQPDRVASAAVPDRPRLGAVHPPQLARAGRARAAAVPARSATTCCCRSRARSRTRTPAWRRDRPRRARRDRGVHPRRLAAARAGAAGPRRPSRAYVDYLLARLEAPRAFVEEADRARAA